MNACEVGESVVFIVYDEPGAKDTVIPTTAVDCSLLVIPCSIYVQNEKLD